MTLKLFWSRLAMTFLSGGYNVLKTKYTYCCPFETAFWCYYIVYHIHIAFIPIFLLCDGVFCNIIVTLDEAYFHMCHMSSIVQQPCNPQQCIPLWSCKWGECNLFDLFLPILSIWWCHSRSSCIWHKHDMDLNFNC